MSIISAIVMETAFDDEGNAYHPETTTPEKWKQLKKVDWDDIFSLYINNSDGTQTHLEDYKTRSEAEELCNIINVGINVITLNKKIEMEQKNEHKPS